ncbi:hypothetical protein SB912_32725, partial [Pantoea sp. SIMBA_072]
PQVSDIDIANGVLISLGANLACFWLFSVISRNVQAETPKLDNSDSYVQQPSLTWARLRSLLSRFYDDQQLASIQQRLRMDL